MSRQLSRALVGVGTSRVDMVSGCVSSCNWSLKVLVSDYVSEERCVHSCHHGEGDGMCVPGVGGLYLCVPVVEPSL